MTGTADELRGATWRTSSSSAASGQCVEVAQLPGPRWAVRDSKSPNGGTLIFTQAEWEAFVAGARDGEFDVPLPDDQRPETAR